MRDQLSRRGLIQVGGVGSATALAGCLDSLPGSDDDDGDGDDNGDGGAEADTIESVDGDQTLTIALSIDQERFEEERAEIQEEVMEEVEDGDIEEEEAQMVMREREMELQMELIEESMGAVEASVEDADGLSLEESSEDTGLALVAGDLGSLVGALDHGSVAALLPEDDYEAEPQQP